jgi:hypothetical protein
LWSAVLAGYALVILGALVPGGTQVKCNQQCDAGYSADVDDCRFQFNTPADADALTDCIQQARDDDDALYEKGMPIRREVLGPEYVDASCTSFAARNASSAVDLRNRTRPFGRRKSACPIRRIARCPAFGV